MSYFSTLLHRSGLDIKSAAVEFGEPLEAVQLWHSGQAEPPARILRTLSILADFAPSGTVQPIESVKNYETTSVAIGNIPPEKPNERIRKSSLGQFLTAPGIAEFMAKLMDFSKVEEVHLLDAGAGQGALTKAAVECWRARAPRGSLSASAYEIDEVIVPELQNVLARLADTNVHTELIQGDFIALTAREVRTGGKRKFTHAILNPPYKKISGNSPHRGLLRLAGLETVNLYSGFVALALELLAVDGELVAIIPRSFCNGPYYQTFRRWIFARAAIRQIHLFSSRNRAFKSDGVLQENVIIHLKSGVPQSDVIISTSEDGGFGDYIERTFPFDKIVLADDADQFIHVPSEDDDNLLATSAFRFSLAEIGIDVSTGPVVDFRLRDDLRAEPEANTVPLLYPGHFMSGKLSWPKQNFKKANAIVRHSATEKWLYPAGFYSVVRRFSAKEEQRRIVANVVDPKLLGSRMIGFENHLNVFHTRRQPLTETIAHGLSVYLNSTPVDRYFRRFNGHTQVNATDLRAMRYPNRSALEALGSWALKSSNPTQVDIDTEVEKLS